MKSNFFSIPETANSEGRQLGDRCWILKDAEATMALGVELIEKILGRSLQVEERNIVRNNELMDVVADISKASDSFAWKPKLTLAEGIKQILLKEGLCSKS